MVTALVWLAGVYTKPGFGRWLVLGLFLPASSSETKASKPVLDIAVGLLRALVDLLRYSFLTVGQVLV